MTLEEALYSEGGDLTNHHQLPLNYLYHYLYTIIVLCLSVPLTEAYQYKMIYSNK